jgi:TPR repeat protein
MAWSLRRKATEPDVVHVDVRKPSATEPDAADRIFDRGVKLQERGDVDAAAECFTQASRMGHVESLNNLGFLAQQRGALREADDLFRRAAEGGSANAMHNLALGRFHDGDFITSKQWASKAVAAGHTGANMVLGEIAYQRRDFDAAMHAYALAALGGDATAMFNVGEIYHVQLEDFGSAIDWYKRAGVAGNLDAMRNLAVLLDEERGDDAQALVWYEKAALAGHVGAMANLGLFFLKRGDRAQARLWWQRAAERGDVRSRASLERYPAADDPDPRPSSVRPDPIVEALNGRLEYLLSTGSPFDQPRVASRAEPFPDAESLQTVLRAKRADTNEWEQYGTGRVANNLAAVYICTAQLTPALDAIQESELKFAEMLNNNNPNPEQLTYRGLAMVRYNAAVLFRALGDIDGNFGKADSFRQAAMEALDEIEERTRTRTGVFCMLPPQRCRTPPAKRAGEQ